jgi:hypothetical protein
MGKGLKYQLSSCKEYWEIVPDMLPAYRVSLKEQTEKWVEGISIHNTFADECCPDLSCCGGTPWPLRLRKIFIEADEQTQINMMFMGLDAMLEKYELLGEVYKRPEEKQC